MTVNVFLMMTSLKTGHVNVSKCFHENAVGGVIVIFTYKVYAGQKTVK